MDLSKRPTRAKEISSKLSKKLKELKGEEDVKDGVDLEKFAKDLAKRRLDQDKDEE